MPLLRSIIFIMVWVIYLSGCVQLGLQKHPNDIAADKVIESHADVATLVRVGDTKENVLAIILPTQKGLPKKYSRLPDKYLSEDGLVEIYFMRSARFPDNRSTDDEFTPYIFKNEVLVGIGWTLLGGPKSIAEPIKQNQSTVTIGGNQQKKDMSILCREALANGDRGAALVHCE